MKYCSTSTIAYNSKIKSHSLFKKLNDSGYIKKDENYWILTKKGEAIGGKYKENDKGNKWIVHIQGRPVALFKYEDKFYALKNGCLHQGFPLAEGNLNKYMVECPLHGWVYDFRDGQCLSTPGRCTKSYKVRINGENLEINMEEKG